MTSYKLEGDECQAMLYKKVNLNLIVFIVQNLTQHLLVNGYIGGHFTQCCVSLLSRKEKE